MPGLGPGVGSPASSLLGQGSQPLDERVDEVLILPPRIHVQVPDPRPPFTPLCRIALQGWGELLQLDEQQDRMPCLPASKVTSVLRSKPAKVPPFGDSACQPSPVSFV
eukprot:1792249-Heterocapsa_arctica.AAC.1